MRTKLKRPISIILATLLLVGGYAAVASTPVNPTPITMGTLSSTNDISAHYAHTAEVRKAAELQRIEIQHAESIRLQAIKARASRGAHRSVVAPRKGLMPTIAQADALGTCECSRNAKCNTSNGFFGAFQFMLSTWRAFRPGNPIDYTYEQQREVILTYFPLSSWPSQFPGCYKKLHRAGVV